MDTKSTTQLFKCETNDQIIRSLNDLIASTKHSLPENSPQYSITYITPDEVYSWMTARLENHAIVNSFLGPPSIV